MTEPTEPTEPGAGLDPRSFDARAATGTRRSGSPGRGGSRGDRSAVQFPPGCRAIEIGAGTGLVGLALLDRLGEPRARRHLRGHARRGRRKIAEDDLRNVTRSASTSSPIPRRTARRSTRDLAARPPPHRGHGGRAGRFHRLLAPRRRARRPRPRLRGRLVPFAGTAMASTTRVSIERDSPELTEAAGFTDVRVRDGQPDRRRGPRLSDVPAHGPAGLRRPRWASSWTSSPATAARSCSRSQSTTWRFDDRTRFRGPSHLRWRHRPDVARPLQPGDPDGAGRDEPRRLPGRPRRAGRARATAASAPSNGSIRRGSPRSRARRPRSRRGRRPLDRSPRGRLGELAREEKPTIRIFARQIVDFARRRGPGAGVILAWSLRLRPVAQVGLEPAAPGKARRAPRSAPRARRGKLRGCRKATGPFGALRGADRSARRRRSRGGSASARFATSKQTWWKPSPLFARKRATPVVSSSARPARPWTPPPRGTRLDRRTGCP